MSPSFSRRSRSPSPAPSSSPPLAVALGGLGSRSSRRCRLASPSARSVASFVSSPPRGPRRRRRRGVGLGRGLVGHGVLPVVRMHSVVGVPLAPRPRWRGLGGPGQALLRPGSSPSSGSSSWRCPRPSGRRCSPGRRRRPERRRPCPARASRWAGPASCAGCGSASSAAAAAASAGSRAPASVSIGVVGSGRPLRSPLGRVAVLLGLGGRGPGGRVVADHVELLAHRPQVRGGPVEEDADRERDTADREDQREDVEQHLLLLGVLPGHARRPACSCSSAGAGSGTSWRSSRPPAPRRAPARRARRSR